MKIRDVPSLTSFNEISVVPGSYRKQINSVYGAVNVGWKHMLYLDATSVSYTHLDVYKRQAYFRGV